MSFKKAWELLRDTASQWLADKAPRLGAALSYYTIFALAPLLVIVIGIAGLAFGDEAAQGYIVGQLENLFGEQGGDAVRKMVQSASKPESGLVGTILGFVMLLFAAGGLFGQLQDSLNTIWGVEPKPGRGIAGFLRDRFLSITMVLGTAFLLLISLVVSAGVAAVADLFGDWQTGILGHILHIVFDLTVITLLIAMLFRFLPDAKVAWRHVWLGAAVTAVLFSVGKVLIGLYLGHSAIASAFGAAGSLAVLLVWLYYTGQIFLFGAEFTKVHALKQGWRIQPTQNAVLVDRAERAEQGLRRDAPSDGKPPHLGAEQTAGHVPTQGTHNRP